MAVGTLNKLYPPWEEVFEPNVGFLVPRFKILNKKGGMLIELNSPVSFPIGKAGSACHLMQLICMETNYTLNSFAEDIGMFFIEGKTYVHSGVMFLFNKCWI